MSSGAYCSIHIFIKESSEFKTVRAHNGCVLLLLFFTLILLSLLLFSDTETRQLLNNL